MAKVIAPEQFTGRHVTLNFLNGVAECEDPALLDWFREHGYTVENAEKPDGESGDEKEKAEGEKKNPTKAEKSAE